MPLSLPAQTTDSLLSERAHLYAYSKNPLGPAAAQSHYLSPQRNFLPLAMVLYGAMSLGNHELQGLNKQVRAEITEHRPCFYTTIDNYLQFAPASAVYLLNAAGVKGVHNFRDRTLLLGSSTLLMAGTVFALKKLTRQVRPDGSASNSFPSGHTATAFSGAAFFSQEYKGYSPWLRYSGYALAAGTGVLRIYNNRHWLSDVIAGAGIGILSTKASYWLVNKIKQGKKRAARFSGAN